MGKERDGAGDLPQTWSEDDKSSTTPPSKRPKQRDAGSAPKDEGIRPQELTTENDQGAG
jgi:hypothetical protein